MTPLAMPDVPPVKFTAATSSSVHGVIRTLFYGELQRPLADAQTKVELKVAPITFWEVRSVADLFRNAA